MPLKLTGRWWLPGKDHEKRDATLGHEQEQFVRLTMAQPGLGGEFRPKLIVGELSDGRPVTIYRARMLDATGSQVAYGGEATLIGIRATSDKDLRFRVMSVSYPQLDSWLGMTFVNSNAATPFDAGGFRATFVQHAPSGLAKGTKPPAKRGWFLRLSTGTPQPFSELRDALLRRVTAFMTLARKGAITPCELRLGRAESDDPGDIIVVTPAIGVQCPQRSPLLWCRNADGRVGIYLDRWLLNGPRFDDIYDLYVSAVRTPGMPSRAWFVTLMQALEGYLRVSQGETASYLDAAAREKLSKRMLEVAREPSMNLPRAYVRDALPPKLRHIAEWSLSRRLRRHGASLRAALKKPAVGSFVMLSQLRVPYQRMVEVRNLLTHTDEPHPNRHIMGWEEPRVLGRFAKLLLEASLLRDLGMRDDEVAEAIYLHYQRHGSLQAWWDNIERAR